MKKLMADTPSCSACLPGVGLSMVMVATLVTIYYSAIVAFTLFYMFASFQSPLPWSSCSGNTATGPVLNAYKHLGNCSKRLRQTLSRPCLLQCKATSAMGWWPTGPTVLVLYPTAHQTLGKARVSSTGSKWRSLSNTHKSKTKNILVKVVGPVLLSRVALQRSSGMDDTGSVVWHMALCLLLSHVIVAAILIKGIKSSGKVRHIAKLSIQHPASVGQTVIPVSACVGRLLHRNVSLRGDPGAVSSRRHTRGSE